LERHEPSLAAARWGYVPRPGGQKTRTKRLEGTAKLTKFLQCSVKGGLKEVEVGLSHSSPIKQLPKGQREEP
jgi:hypothetical protein